MHDLKVLHVHPKIGIGGVETYLCRLLPEQRRRGATVGLLTAGGVFEERLEAAGVQVFRLPIRKHGLDANVTEALALLQEHGFQLVHSHNYRASRVGRRLAGRLGAAYVMSVHGPRPVWHRLTFHDWSRWVVAMSEGDRDNVTAFGGIAPGRVITSFYGIDVDRFRPGLDVGPLRCELGLAPDALPLVVISRFAHEKARVAQALMDAVGLLSPRFPSAVALLVGEGPAHARLQAHAEALNRRLGRQAAVVVGPRQDVERFMNLAAVVVATANTALEAMACGAPTIAAGRAGCFGPVVPASFEDARAVCFGDHGRVPGQSGPPEMAEALRGLLSARAAAVDAAQANREIIVRRYSVPAMADSIEAVYGRVMSDEQ